MDEATGSALRQYRDADGSQWVNISVNGRTIRALRGESLASALLAEGFLTLRHTLKSASPRGMYCGMGTCFECLVTVNGQGFVRACMTPIEAGLQVETGNHER